MLGACLSAFAQQLQVTGTVKDHTGNPVAGATILVEGSTTGTTSNAVAATLSRLPRMPLSSSLSSAINRSRSL